MGKCLQWCKHSLPSPAIASLMKPPPSGRGVISCREFACRFSEQSLSLYHPSKAGILRSRSWPGPEPRRGKLQRSRSASDDTLHGEEFERRFQELERRFQELEGRSILPADDVSGAALSESARRDGSSTEMSRSFGFNSLEPAERRWASNEDEFILPAIIERKANSVDMPISLRMLKRKRQWQERFRAAGDSACCSVKKAFSSMVFIVRELQSYTLQMRENIFCGDLEWILKRMHDEMHLAFVSLFQHIFSQTPVLMLSVMILLANFTVHSMSNAATITVPAALPAALTDVISIDDRPENLEFGVAVDSLLASAHPSSVGGSGGGGGKAARLGSAPSDEGDAVSEQMVVSTWDRYWRVVAEESSVESEEEKEVRLWNSVEEEAYRMRFEVWSDALDHATMQMLVSPVTVEMEPEDYEVFSRTELLYWRAAMEEPDNPLVLSNYAQFLYLVIRNLDRAEEYFKRASRVEPPDADALLRYAAFLWVARKDLGAAEDTYLRAVEAEPGNPFFASCYASFLWLTGGTETCFPLS